MTPDTPFNRENPELFGLPPNAKRVFAGKIFDTWQWPQKLFDGSEAIFEKIVRFPTTSVIATAGEKILLSNEEQPGAPPFRDFPGGRVDPGEAPLTAAKRELLEETGMISDSWELLQRWVCDGKIRWFIFNFIARDCQKVAEADIDAGEKISSKWIDFEELLMLSDDPKFRGRELKELFLRARFLPEKKEELRRKLFSSS